MRRRSNIDTRQNRTIAFSQPALFCALTMRYTATSGNATEQPPDTDMARKTSHLFTIGYEQTPPKAVLDELQKAGVKLLVDVRAVVSSRRPGFSKNQLAAALDERGISYIHMKGLGTPKEGRLAARSGDMKTLRADLRKAPENNASQRRARRIVVAGDEGGAGMPALLRA